MNTFRVLFRVSLTANDGNSLHRVFFSFAAEDSKLCLSREISAYTIRENSLCIIFLCDDAHLNARGSRTAAQLVQALRHTMYLQSVLF